MVDIPEWLIYRIFIMLSCAREASLVACSLVVLGAGCLECVDAVGGPVTAAGILTET